jgi:hypothetical protein
MNFETMVTNQLSPSLLSLAFNTLTPAGEIIQKHSPLPPFFKHPFVYTYIKMIILPHKNNINIILTPGFKKISF